MAIKKISAIILSIVMIFSMMSVAISAAEIEVNPFDTVTVTASLTNNPVLKFVSAETKTLVVKSDADEEVDPYCVISIDGAEVYMMDDSRGSTNFEEKYEFEAGVVYYLTISTYSEYDATFDISFECSHEWNGDLCVNCGGICDHETEGAKFKTCDCGQYSTAETIKIGDTVNKTFQGDDPIVMKFIPEEDVAAILYSNVYDVENAYDVYAAVYDAQGEEIAYGDDFSGSYDFVVWCEFTAGETYFLEIKTYYEDIDVEFSFVKAVHTAEDGSEHDVVFTDYVFANCQETCYTEGIYCAECDAYLAGHVDNGPGYCYDNDFNMFCDYCGKFTGLGFEIDLGIDLEALSPLNIINKISEMLKSFINMLYKVFAMLDFSAMLNR